MKNSNLLLIAMGLLALSGPAMAVSVTGQAYIQSLESYGTRTFELGNKKNSSLAPFSEVNFARYQDSCAVAMAAIVNDWGKNGIQSPELEEALRAYKAELPSDQRNVTVFMEAGFYQQSPGVAKDGTRRFRPVHHLHFNHIILSLGAGDDRVAAGPADFHHYNDSEACDDTPGPDLILTKFIDELRSKTESIQSTKRQELEDEVRRKNEQRIDNAVFGDLMQRQ